MSDVSTTFNSSKPAAELAQTVASIFQAEGYSLEDGTAERGEYGKGSKLMRALLGAFAERYVFFVEITEENGQSVLKLSKHGVSSMSGGLLGARKYNKEYTRLSELFTSKLG